jgi:exosortase
MVAVLLLACYAPLLAGLARQWSTDPDMSHGFLVLPVAAFVVWRRRAEIAGGAQRERPRPELVGPRDRGLGGGADAAGHAGGASVHRANGLSGFFTGAVLFLGGTRALKTLAFPLLLLLFLFPIPAIVYARITLPLQIFASAAAETVLNGIGIPVLRDGNILELPHQRLSVVEACSGIRSLLSLGFLALVYAYFFDQRVRMRWVLLAATVPIAIAANAARVTLMGILGEYHAGMAYGGFHLLRKLGAVPGGA